MSWQLWNSSSPAKRPLGTNQARLRADGVLVVSREALTLLSIDGACAVLYDTASKRLALRAVADGEADAAVKVRAEPTGKKGGGVSPNAIIGVRGPLGMLGFVMAKGTKHKGAKRLIIRSDGMGIIPLLDRDDDDADEGGASASDDPGAARPRFGGGDA